jgi:hypothetical protein
MLLQVEVDGYPWDSAGEVLELQLEATGPDHPFLLGSVSGREWMAQGCEVL